MVRQEQGELARLERLYRQSVRQPRSWRRRSSRTRVSAVVCHGGWPDLAGNALSHVRVPTLLIVCGDGPVLSTHQETLRSLRCEKRLVVVPRATHREKGKVLELELVGALASHWFVERLDGASRNRGELDLPGP